ncbi:DUF3829 domain-containing protein [Fusobacterium russii]|uniref:DUF3829 domain-containing protein n=1 Tax=Fusobacterium russii TaxID=854 RepID=UPI0003A61B5F|nr:DUF3829 domain-containing protein [Fusobacterium russii]
MKKILFLLIIVFGISLISCNKSEEKEVKLVNDFEYGESLFLKNQDKYLAYTDLYYKLIYANPVYNFDEKYIKEIFDEAGKAKKIKGESVKDLGLVIKNQFKELENTLKEIKLYANQEPSYAFDNKMEALTAATFRLKEKIMPIIEYYDEASYKKDNYKKIKNFYKEYKPLLDEATLYYEEFIHRIYILKEKEISSNTIDMLKRYKKVSKIDLLKFSDVTKEFLSLSFSKERLDFLFSETELEELKEINKEIVDRATRLEATPDKQLDMEEINIIKFRERIVPDIKEVVNISTDIIKLLEKNEGVEKRIYDLDTAFFNLTNTIHTTFEEDSI